MSSRRQSRSAPMKPSSLFFDDQDQQFLKQEEPSQRMQSSARELHSRVHNTCRSPNEREKRQETAATTAEEKRLSRRMEKKEPAVLMQKAESMNDEQTRRMNRYHSDDAHRPEDGVHIRTPIHTFLYIDI